MIDTVTTRPVPAYGAVWRWHFYAGLFCIPFVIWLALTGSIYLWKPQIEAWLDRPYDHLATTGPIASPDAQVAAALRAVPGSTLRKYMLPQSPAAAVRVLVAEGGEDRRVLVDPRTLAVLDVVREERRPMRMVFHLHGELLAGAWGSYLVETAACWTIVMLITGLYLWWPRGRRGLAGVLYPRLRSGRRMLWRDLHATTGVWVSLLALGLVLTGLPWAKGWGGYLGEVRALTGATRGVPDWTIGGKAPKADPMFGEHDGHGMMPGGHAMMPGGRWAMSGEHGMMSGEHAEHGVMPPPSPSARPGELARVIATVRPLGVAPPVLIAPPASPGAPWSVASDAPDRPLRSNLKVDGATGALVGRTDFAERHWIDRTIGYGIAAHEGALFGLANQLLATVTALLLVLLSVSGAVMWWRRRPVESLGAPPLRSPPRFGAGLFAAIGVLGLCFPMFGLTLLAVLAFEAIVLRRLPGAARWIGLGDQVRPT